MKRVPLKVAIMTVVQNDGTKGERVVCSGGWSARSNFALTFDEARTLHNLLGQLLAQHAERDAEGCGNQLAGQPCRYTRDHIGACATAAGVPFRKSAAARLQDESTADQHAAASRRRARRAEGT